MQLVKLRIQQQAGLKGSVVNVPSNINKITTLLPRSDLLEHTIIVNLKRKLSYNHAYIKAYVRPAVIQAGLQYLLQQPLYKEHGASLSSCVHAFHKP